MKRVRIAAGQAAIITKHGSYQRTLTAGVHWLGFFEKAEIHNMERPFVSELPVNLLLQDSVLSNLLYIVEVADSQIALQYEDGNLKTVLQPGKHIFWKGINLFSFIHIDLKDVDIPDSIEANTLVGTDLARYVRTFVVESYEKGLLFRDGQLTEELGAGVYRFWKNAETINLLTADLRQQQLEVSGQEILTKDKAGIRVNFQAFYRVVDIHKALVDTRSFTQSLYAAVQLVLREFVGTMTLDELLEKKEAIAPYMMEVLAPKAAELGVEIQTCGIKDIILPGDVKEIMSRVLIAQKTAQANIITRREETASTRSLLNTAKLMEENEMLFKLKEMEYVEKIAEKINSISVSGGGQIVDQLRDIFTK